jgi:hypothetical protein
MDCARNGAPDLVVPITEGPEGKRHTASGMALEREAPGKVTEFDIVFRWIICANAACNLPAYTRLSLGRWARSG